MYEGNSGAQAVTSLAPEHNSLIVSDSKGREGLERMPLTEKDTSHSDYQWFIMRDLKRPNAKNYNYTILEEKSFKIFLPIEKRVSVVNGKRKIVEKKLFYNLFFVYSNEDTLLSSISHAYSSEIALHDLKFALKCPKLPKTISA